MKLIDQYHEILTPLNNTEVSRFIELCVRVCYKSEERITPESSEHFVQMLIKSGHHSVLEHFNISVRFITDRGITHELVRHRLCAFSQESTRYCDYSSETVFIRPVTTPIQPTTAVDDGIMERLMIASEQAEENYKQLRSYGCTPQEARAVLPNNLKTEIICTTNIREWRHILTLRCSPKAHPQMRALMLGLLADFKLQLPTFFHDIY